MKNEDFLKKTTDRKEDLSFCEKNFEKNNTPNGREYMRETQNTRRRARRVLFKSMIIVLLLVLVLNEMALFTRMCAPRFVK